MRETYIDRWRAVLREELARVDLGWTPGERILDLYTLLVLTRGVECTSEDVHNAWAADTVRDRPGHPDLVPFADLSPAVRAFDDRYRDAIRATARRMLAGAA